MNRKKLMVALLLLFSIPCLSLYFILTSAGILLKAAGYMCIGETRPARKELKELTGN